MTNAAVDAVLWNDWHVVAELEALRSNRPLATALLDTPIRVSLTASVAAVSRADGAPVRSMVRYGFVWACLGEPTQPVIEIAEANEADRIVTTGGSIGVHASGPRVIENFLDLGHLPFVHVGYLGVEDRAEIGSYEVSSPEAGGIVAKGCRVFQPMGSPAAKGGYVVDYIYEVRRPLTVCLYKANPLEPQRFDVIYLFVQPVSQEQSVAHALMLFPAVGTTAKALRSFQQLIFLQDKPILENQVPKRLPLGPAMEVPAPVDKSSIAYRRWLSRLDLRYGVIREPVAGGVA